MTAKILKIIATRSICLILLALPLSSHALKIPWWHKHVDIIVSIPFVEFRTGPGRGHPIYHVAEKGDIITIKKKRGDWFKAVTADGKEGWVYRTAINNAVTTDNKVLTLKTPGWEEYLNRKVELGILYGDSSGADSYTLLGGYHLTPNLAIETKYIKNFDDFFNSYIYTFNMVHHPFTSWKLSPFFSIGAGRLQVTPNPTLAQPDEKEAKQEVYSVGGGLNYYLTRRFNLRIEYTNHTGLKSPEENIEVNEWKAGFSIFF